MPKAAPLPSLVDHLTAEDVYGVFDEEALSEGKNAVERGRVARPAIRLATADTVVVGADRRSHRARLSLAGGEVASSCTCGARRCQHAAALGLLLLGEAGPREQRRSRRQPRCARSRPRAARRSLGAVRDPPAAGRPPGAPRRVRGRLTLLAYLNEHFLALSEWTENLIISRGEALAKQLVAMWQGPV
jgi:hypothetical protein